MRTLLYVLVAGLAGCAVSPGADSQDRRVDIDSHTLLAELALQRQQPARATEHYAEIARLSNDPADAAHATRMAHQFEMTEVGLDAARRWRELDPDDERAYWFAAVLEMRAGNDTRALEDFRGLIERVGESGVGLALVTEGLIQEADAARAAELMQTLVDEHPGTLEGRYGLARIALRAGQFDVALDNARRVSELDPDWIEGQLLYARTLLLTGRTTDGLALAGRLAEQHPELEVRLQYAELLLSAGRYQEAETLLEDILDDHPGLPEAIRALGFLALSEDRLDTARQHFNSLRTEPRYRDEAFFYLGRIAETEERFLQATRSYSRVTDGEHAVEAQLRTARLLYAEMGDRQGALRHLLEFGNANPRFRSDMLVARGQLLLQMDDMAGALALLGEAVEADPTDDTLRQAHAQLYVIMAQDAIDGGHLEEAENLLDEGLARHPLDVSLRYARALLYERQDRPRQAVGLLRELVREHPDDPLFLNALGYIMTDRLDRHEEARGYIQQALAMEPDNPAIIDSMGWLLFRMGDYEAALGYLERAYRLEDDPEIAAHLVDVHWALGNRHEAMELLRQNLAVHPDNRHLREVSRRLEQ